jgi:hypothetical protein
MVQQSTIQIYCELMTEAKDRVALVRRFVHNRTTFGTVLLDYEFLSLHFRKILELIAFGSLAANKDEYAKVHPRFDQHWKAVALLEALIKVHPAFYPKPVCLKEPRQRGDKSIAPLGSGYLTTEEFVELYDKCCQVIHTWNPFTTRERHIDFRLSPMQWAARIENLLALHVMHPAGTEERWLIRLADPSDGKVHAFVLQPVD